MAIMVIIIIIGRGREPDSGEEITTTPPGGLDREIRVVVGGAELGRYRHAGAGAPERYVEGGEVGGDGAGAGGCDDGGLRLLEQPLDGLTVGLVAELPGQLEDPGGAEGRHSDAAAAAVHLRVAVFRRCSLRWWLL